MTSRPDPYALDNFKRAYDNLLAGRSVKTVSQSLAADLSKVSLQPTHYAIKVYPKTQEEQRMLELSSDVTVSYFPFDYAPLPSEITKDWNREDAGQLIPQEGRYTETYEDGYSSEGPIETFSITLPVLYAVWPCDKPFPAGMDYDILYEVFIPSDTPQTKSTDLSTEENAMQVLEEEAIRQCLGVSPLFTRANVSWQSATARGKVFHSDGELNEYVPVANVKIRYQLGTRVWETFTGSDGNFFIGNAIPAEANLYFIFQTNKWTVTTQRTTAAYTISRGYHYDNYPDANFYGIISIPIFETHRAANFYYNTSHNVPKYYYETGMRMIVLDYVHPEWGGRFSYFPNKPAYIQISTNYDDGYLIGAVLHELGHWAQYNMKGYKAFADCQDLIIESWASYVGWYLGELYYTSLGWVKLFPSSDITTQAQQSWTGIDSDPYSPLFVDLRDSYNQPNAMDAIQNVSFSIINDVAKKASDWQSCKTLLRSHLSSLYSNSVLENFFAPYDEYINPGEIRLYPNPVTNGTLNIRLGGGITGNATIRIYDSAARLVYTTTRANVKPGNILSISVNSLSPGIYTLRLSYTGTNDNPAGNTSSTFMKS